MALLDIVIEGYQAEVEEYRGNTGTVTDMVMDAKNESIFEIPAQTGGGADFEYTFGFIG